MNDAERQQGIFVLVVLQLFKMYNEADPPPVDLIRVPVFLGELSAYDMVTSMNQQMAIPYNCTI